MNREGYTMRGSIVSDVNKRLRVGRGGQTPLGIHSEETRHNMRFCRPGKP